MYTKKIEAIRKKIQDLYTKLETPYKDGDMGQAYKIMPDAIQDAADLVQSIEEFLAEVDKDKLDPEMYQELKVTATVISQMHDFLSNFWHSKPDNLILH